MVLPYNALINNQFYKHTQKAIYLGEIISFYIDLLLAPTLLKDMNNYQIVQSNI